MLNILPAAFLIAAQNQAYLAAQGDARVLDGLHGVQRGHGGALVVAGAAAVHAAVFNHSAVGGILPAVALGHHVQMRQDGQRVLVAALAQIGMGDIAVKVLRLKAHLLAIG